MAILLAGKLDACVAGFFLAVHVEFLTVMVGMLMAADRAIIKYRSILKF